MVGFLFKTSKLYFKKNCFVFLLNPGPAISLCNFNICFLNSITFRFCLITLISSRNIHVRSWLSQTLGSPPSYTPAEFVDLTPIGRHRLSLRRPVWLRLLVEFTLRILLLPLWSVPSQYWSFLASSVGCGTGKPNHQQNPGRPVGFCWWFGSPVPHPTADARKDQHCGGTLSASRAEYP